MAEENTSLLVRFECLSAKTITTNEIELPPVSTVQQIKEYFEEKHDIPVCLQTIRHRSVVLKQDTPVASLRLRHGDELHVSYYAKAECQEMRRVLRWLEAFVDCTVHGREFPLALDKEEPVLENVGFEFFLPWETPVKLANKKVFVYHGGLSFNIQLHRHLLSYQWEQLPAPLKLIECQVLLVLWNLCETLPYRQAIYDEGCLSDAVKSLLRVPVLPGQPIIDPTSPDDSSTIIETLQTSIGVLSCMTEISPSCHMDLATDASAMVQLSNMMQCPSIDGDSVVIIVILCLSIAYSVETHSYLVEAGLIERFLAPPPTSVLNENAILYQYHVAVFLAQIVLGSLPLDADKEERIDSFLTNFVKKAQPSQLAQTEADSSYLWATILPYVKLVYLPNSRPDTVLIQSVALQVIIMALHIMLDREVHRDVLIREGLMDYITCMPWYTTGAAEQRARALVRMVQQAPDVDLQPPSLLNMTKAVLSKNGLQTVVHLSVPEILQTINF